MKEFPQLRFIERALFIHVCVLVSLRMFDVSETRYINGYNDPEIIAGAGSIGVEIIEQVGALVFWRKLIFQ